MIQKSDADVSDAAHAPSLPLFIQNARHSLRVKETAKRKAPESAETEGASKARPPLGVGRKAIRG
jgi:hypothetical protein